MIDLISIAVDSCAGLALAIWLFATPPSAWVIALGAVAAMALQFVHSIYPLKPLVSLRMDPLQA
jgi:hypothetical protein